nr:hypothetical protein [bacterium]
MPILDALNTKSKAFVVLLFSLVSIGLFPVSTFIAASICQSWYGLVVGLLLMALAIPFHYCAKKHPKGYFVSFFTNSIANGFSASAYYLAKNIPLDWCQMLLAAMPAAAILGLVYVMLQKMGKTKKTAVLVAAVIDALLILLSLALWIVYGKAAFSFGFFCAWIALFYLCVFGITIHHDGRAVMRDISFGSFGAFIMLTVVVIFILSEGEALDGLDLDLFEGRKNKHKK